jgi:DNA repair exonuclease SbcCD ATPase subunit
LTSSLATRASVISKRLEATAENYQRKLAVVERLQAQYAAASAEEKKFLTQVGLEEKAQAVLLALEAAWRKDFEKQVEEVVTEGIQLVFDSNDYFTLITKVERGASAIEFELETADGAVQNIMDGDGASIGQVVSFLLRILLILAHKPALRKVIILDEPFVGLRANRLPALQELLRKIVDETGIQLIMVTHNESFIDVADVAYEVTKTKGIGRVEKIA